LKRALALAALCVVVGRVASAGADEPVETGRTSARALAAEQLFKEGRRLITKRRFTEACEKLNASEKLDRAVGTLVSLGECNTGMGRTASAWLAYRAAIALATERHDVRKAGIEERAAAVEPLLANLVVNLSAGAAAASTQIAVDGESVGREIVGTTLPTDPGPHAIVATAPGYKPWSGHVQLTLGATIEVTVPPLEPLPDPSVVEHAQRAAETRRMAGLVTGGVGLVGLGVGLLLGGQAIVKIRDANDLCPGSLACANQAAVNENQTGKSLGIASSVLVPVSVAALAAGSFLIVTSRRPRGAEVAADVSTGGARLRVEWSW
jgi:serine/threonine-protein kinase